MTKPEVDARFEGLMAQAENAFASNSQPLMLTVGGQLLSYSEENPDHLLEQWQIDQLEAGYTRLTGNGPGKAEKQKSVAGAFLSSLPVEIGKRAEELRNQADDFFGKYKIPIYIGGAAIALLAIASIMRSVR